MQPSRKLQAEQKGGKGKQNGKRKLSEQDPEAYEKPPPQQKSIADLFSRSKESSNRQFQLSPTSKRPRRDNLYPSAHSPISKPDIIPPEEMYSFTNSGPKANGIIDLTNSPTSSPCKAAMRAKGKGIQPQTPNFSPHTGAKKLVVKNLRTAPRVNPEQYFTKVWAQLDSSLKAIFDNGKPTHSLEELYKGSENLCRQGKAPELYKKLHDRCEGHIAGTLRDQLRAKAGVGREVDTLHAVVEAWSKWKEQMVTLRSIFFYMDQSYSRHSAESPCIYEMGLAQYRSFVFSDDILKPIILQGACDLIDFDRKGDQNMIDSKMLRQSIGLFHDLGVYTTDFEPRMVQESQNYFNSWADTEASGKSLASYVKSCHRLLEDEMNRCDLFSLDRSTRRDLSKMLDDSLILKKQEVLLEHGDVRGLLKSNDAQALEQLYTLLQRTSLGAELRPWFVAYINEEGSAIVFDEAREAEMVIRLLEFKKKLDHIWKFAFHVNETLGHSLREAFETFINKTKKSQANWNTDNPKPGEMIAKHVDMLLKGGTKAMSASISASTSMVLKMEDADDDALVDEDAEISRQLDQVLDLFRFVHGKAVFEAFYKKDLARRLLMARSASADAERSMLSRLKTECGSGFTHYLESMFKDMELARDEMLSYKTLLDDRHTHQEVDLSVNVLSSSAWPTYPDVPVNIPTSISKAIHNFDQHYTAKYNGRKLTWKHALAHCQLKAKFPRGNKDIVVSSFQAIVLLLFNDVSDCGSLSYKEIQAASGLSDAELKRTLQSLACAKYRVLTKSPKGRDVHDTDTFTFNSNFSDPKMRIKINQIQLKETKEENKETHQRVAADRHYETQAAIVRIMKSRKTIKHAELVAEVIKATKSRGVLDPADIKKNIEKLIEKDYLEREEGNTYNYLA